MPFAPIPVSTQDIVTYLTNKCGTEVTTMHLQEASEHFDCSLSTVKKRLKTYKHSIGKWDLTIQEAREKLEKTVQKQNLVPELNDSFVRFGNYNDIKKIIQSEMFYPTFVTGLSGNGKTFSIEQACAQLGRELIRVNITIETDEDDLIGGFRLVNGETVWHNGPVIEALERGAILLLDEIDLASNKILCLQSVLEGNGVFLKKIGRFVRPARGFNIFATANTKGKGSDDGRFIGTNVLNEAFLERFPVTFEQDYPSPKTELKILENAMTEVGVKGESEFCKRLVDWADIIRKTFYDGGIDEVISTRRLVHILHSYKIFSNKEKSIQVCINRFDAETKQSFLELYDKVDVEFQISKSELNDESVEKL